MEQSDQKPAIALCYKGVFKKMDGKTRSILRLPHYVAEMRIDLATVGPLNVELFGPET
jgi:hypothetical protein